MRGGDDSREGAQLHTLEGFAAAFLILTAMIYTVSSVAVTPTTSSTSSQEIQSNLQDVSESLLARADEQGELKTAMLNWSNGEFNRSSNGTISYRGKNPPGEFGSSLNQTLLENGVSYNLLVYYNGSDGDRQTIEFVENGEPSSNAVSTSEIITLHDGDRLPTGERLDNQSNHPSYPIEDVSDDGIYNVLEVRIIVWRM